MKKYLYLGLFGLLCGQPYSQGASKSEEAVDMDFLYARNIDDVGSCYLKHMDEISEIAVGRAQYNNHLIEYLESQVPLNEKIKFISDTVFNIDINPTEGRQKLDDMIPVIRNDCRLWEGIITFIDLKQVSTLDVTLRYYIRERLLSAEDNLSSRKQRRADRKKPIITIQNEANEVIYLRQCLTLLKPLFCPQICDEDIEMYRGSFTTILPKPSYYRKVVTSMTEKTNYYTKEILKISVGAGKVVPEVQHYAAAIKKINWDIETNVKIQEYCGAPKTKVEEALEIPAMVREEIVLKAFKALTAGLQKFIWVQLELELLLEKVKSNQLELIDVPRNTDRTVVSAGGGPADEILEEANRNLAGAPEEILEATTAELSRRVGADEKSNAGITEQPIEALKKLGGAAKKIVTTLSREDQLAFALKAKEDRLKEDIRGFVMGKTAKYEALNPILNRLNVIPEINGSNVRVRIPINGQMDKFITRFYHAPHRPDGSYDITAFWRSAVKKAFEDAKWI
ncbi:MAG: hypothetical protein WCG05_00855 [Alphaproteobacteria bacterium]